jgi:hypothetical protein
VWIGEPFCAKGGVETGTRQMKLGGDDIGNLRIHFGCWDEMFMDGSVSANSTPHNQGPWGQIDLVQSFCPRLFRSSPMPPGYRSVSVGNGKA